MNRLPPSLATLFLAVVLTAGCSGDSDLGSAVSSVLGGATGTAAAQTSAPADTAADETAQTSAPADTAADETAQTSAPETQPAETTPPETEPAPTTTVAGEDGDDGTNWLPVVLVVAGVLLAIALISLVLSRRRLHQTQQAQLQRELAAFHANVINNLAWMVDVVTPRVTNRTYDPADARELAFWGDARGRLTHLRASMTSALEQDRSEQSTAAVNRALLALDALVGAVEDDRNLRSTAAADAERPDAFESSLQLVAQRREELRSATDALRFAWQGQ